MMNRDMKPSVFSIREIAPVSGFAFAYFVAHQIAFFFPDSEKVIMAVWPAGGIGLAAFLLSPYRRWPVLVLAFYIAGVTADVVLARRPFFTGMGYMTGNMVESLGCAVLILKISRKNVRFDRIQEVLALILGTIFVNAVSACIGAGTGVLSGSSSFGYAWLSWYVSDGLGVLIITPVIVTWAKLREGIPNLQSFRPFESAGFILFWCVVAWFSLDPSHSLFPVAPYPYMLIALLAWPAFRLGQHIVSTAVVLLAVFAIANLLLHPSVSSLGGKDVTEQLLLTQLFLGFAATTGYLLAATHAEAQAAEREVRARNERFLKFASLVPGMLYQFRLGPDETFSVPFSTDIIWDLFGCSPEAVKEDFSPIAGVILPEDLPKVVDSIRASENDLSLWQCEYRVKLPGKSEKWLWGKSIPEKQPDGSIVWYGFNADITDRKLAEQQREQLLRALQAKTDELESIIYVSSHDFRSPLVNIQGFSRELGESCRQVRKLLSDNAVASPDHHQLEALLEQDIPSAIEYICTSVSKLDALQMGLLKICRIGRESLDIRKVVMDDLIDRTVKTVRFQLDNAAAQVTVEPLPDCLADAGQLTQVFTNLIDNAIKYRSPQRTLAIRIYGRVEGTCCVYAVADNGIGIAPEYYQKVFEMFQQLNPVNGPGGEGLGLAIVKRILGRMEGQVRLESALGVGSVFTVLLPKA
jgi:signal transduction histidine kinase/integral membrane sensor domain MASE1